jgi:hypothetical protein
MPCSTLAPLARVVVAFEERPLDRHAQPDVPAEVRRDRVGAVRSGVPVPPLLAAPAVDLLYLADRPLLDGGDDTPVDLAGVALDAHLRDGLLLRRHAGQLPGLVEVMGQRLLGVDVQALLHRPYRDRGVHVVRRGDVHRVEGLLLVEQLPPVLVDLHVGELPLDLGGAAQVHVGRPPIGSRRRRRHGVSIKVRPGHGLPHAGTVLRVLIAD